MLLNCDMGESFASWSKGNDELVMPYVQQANIACGFHASDPQTMDHTVKLAKTAKVTIGAHPGYDDLAGFGRRSIPTTPHELRCLLLYQIGALNTICDANNVQLRYIKPHGALYNDMMENEAIFKTIIETIAPLNLPLKLMIQAGPKQSHYQALADDIGIELLFEAFIDRRYLDDGQLMPRQLKGAVLNNKNEIFEQISTLKQGYVKTNSGNKLLVDADTLCIHGDNLMAVKLISQIATQLEII